MKIEYNLNIPKKSLFGFKILSSFQSSIYCYVLLITGRILNPFFGFSQIQMKAGALFNIILNMSIITLTTNLFIKRKQIKKIYFILLNFMLFIYLPISIYIIAKSINLYLIV